MKVIELVPVRTGEDIRAVARLADEIWKEYFPALIGKAQVEYMLEQFQSAAALGLQIQEGHLYYLIRKNNVDVGYAGLVPHNEQRRMQISKLYLLKNNRGQGLARESLAEIRRISIALGFTRLFLTVNKYNTPSIKAYESMAFVNVGDIVADIGGGFIMDDYEMELDIAEHN